MLSERFKRGMRLFGVILLGVSVGMALIWMFQRRLVYFPDTSSPRPPADVEEVSYSTEDGLELTGWFVSAPLPTGTVLVFPGNAGNRAARLPLARALSDRGFATLLVDYRGYGGNPGSPTEEGLAADARAAVSHLRTRPDVDSARLVYFGESLGAAVAVTLAAGDPPAALVLRSPFTSLPDIGRHHYPWLPISALARDRFANLTTIEEVDVPVLVVAGSEDRIVPPVQSRRLYEVVPGHKRLLIVEGAGHNDFALLAGDELIDTTVAFAESAVDSEENR